MRWVTITGLKPYDGRYELDLDGNELTAREWGWIRRLTGYMPATINDAWAGGDAEAVIMLAVIALRRAGKITVDEVSAVFARFTDEPFTFGEPDALLQLETSDEQVEEEDADPTASAPGKPPSSGASTRTSSETSAATPNESGHTDSDTSPWALATSAT